MRQILLILLLTFSTLCQAQKPGYKSGYIITLDGDTLQGWIKDRSPEPYVELYNRIRFIPDGKKRRKKLSPDGINGYGYEGIHFLSIPYFEEQVFFARTRYHSRPSDPRRFFKVIRFNEKLRYYEREYIHDDNFYPDFVPFFHVPEKGEMVRVTQGILGYKKQRLTEYFDRCPDLSSEFEEVDIRSLYRFILQNCLE